MFMLLLISLILHFATVIMPSLKKIKNALISVYYKDNLEPIIKKLNALGVNLYSTGGTLSFIHSLAIPVNAVEDLTSFPEILGGRVKTLHPKIFGGILGRREQESDLLQMEKHQIPEIDLVIVDLYPFEETVQNYKATNDNSIQEQDIIEKIDIGGISLIRAAAKNFKDVLIISSRNEYSDFLELLEEKNGFSEISDRRKLAAKAFAVSSHYDTAIFSYFNSSENLTYFRESYNPTVTLRYGENPHQRGFFHGRLSEMFEKLSGKELSYNNLLDVDAAVHLMAEYTETSFAILKHNNACGMASRENVLNAWNDALAGDPVSAFGGILICNSEIDQNSAQEINKLFFEVIIAPSYAEEAIAILKSKPNRIILVQKNTVFQQKTFRTLLNGVIEQDRDTKTETITDLQFVTKLQPSETEIEDLLFANKLVKHTKSNTIVLVKNKQLLASGTGQTSRVDALRQAIQKANSFGFELNGAVMASDAFFPFPDCVEIAEKAGIRSVIQPGGSIKDKESIDYCNRNNVNMVITGTRHFKH